MPSGPLLSRLASFMFLIKTMHAFLSLTSWICQLLFNVVQSVAVVVSFSEICSAHVLVLNVLHLLSCCLIVVPNCVVVVSFSGICSAYVLVLNVLNLFSCCSMLFNIVLLLCRFRKFAVSMRRRQATKQKS